MNRTLARTLLIAGLLALMAGCSGLRLGYRHADTFLAWRADEYFDLDSRQKQEFNTRMARLLEWHRYQQLPEYATFVQEAIQRSRSQLKREDIIWFVDGIQARYRLVVDRGIADATDMLADISPAQIQELQNKWTRDNRRFTREHEIGRSTESRMRARTERTLTSIREWTGDLTDDQERKIEALLESVPLINHLRHEDRLRRQKEFLELLKLRANRAEFQRRLHAWLRNWRHGRTPEFERLMSEVYEKRIQFYMAVEKLLTPSQRNAAVRRLNEFAEDFITLSKKPETGALSLDLVEQWAYACPSGRYACLSP